MTPGVLRSVSDETNLEKQLERQMGCMAGFFQIFERHHLISSKRIYGPKRIPSFHATGSTSPSERSDLSAKEASDMFPSSPENMAETPAEATFPLPVFNFKEGMKNSWKLREAPRLSLDSRLRPREIRTTPPASYSPNQSDADSYKNSRSPSVVARLMGLDALPGAGPAGEMPKTAELRRSASESRVSGDLHRFVEGSFFLKPPPPPPDFAGDEIYKCRSTHFPAELKQAPLPTKQFQSHCHSVGFQRRSYFNPQEVFPEQNRTGSRSLYGEIEKRLRMRGIDEPEKDLETLKQILEALQLKGLLHSNGKGSNQQMEHQRRNLISDGHIVVMKPGPRPVRRSGSELRRPVSGRRCPVEEGRIWSRSRSLRSPASNPNPRSRPLNGEMNGRISPVHNSPKSSPRRLSPDPVTARSPRNRRVVREKVCLGSEDDTATISESSASSSSLFYLERSRMENRAGRSLLERCDKLLNSIAAFTSAEQLTASDQQPSPVSVLDSSYLDDESSPSPVKKRSMEFKDWEGKDWVPASPTTVSRPGYVSESEYLDFVYVSNVLLAYDRHRDSSSDMFHFEKPHGAAYPSRESMLHRRLMFDTVGEILRRKKQVSPWESFLQLRPVSEGKQLIREVWAEVRLSGENVAAAEDMNEAACRAIRKDMACGDHGWGNVSAEMSVAVLHIERLVFKDLIGEMIQDLADLSDNNKIRNPLPRRKLLF